MSDPQTTSTKTKKAVIKGVGNLLVKDYKTGAKQMVLARLQSVNLEFAINPEDVWGGDTYFPFTSFVTSKELNISASTALFDVRIAKMLLGGTEKLSNTSDTVWEISEGIVIDETGDDLTYTLKNGATLVEDSLVVYYTDSGEELTPKEETLAKGEYELESNGKITFHTGDKGENISFEYQYTVETDSLSIAVDDIPGTFSLLHVAKLQTDDFDKTIQIIVYRVKPQGTLSLDFARDTAASVDINLKAMDALRADKKICDIKIF